jgi:folate-binding protein YgfZ
VVRVQGDDRLSWLNGQVTNDLRALENAGSVHALAVHVRGKIMADLWVVATSDELLIVIPKSAKATLLESFERYIIMEDVTLVPWPGAQVLSVVGPEASQLTAAVSVNAVTGYACDELGLGGYAFVGERAALEPIMASLAAAGAVSIDERGYELVRLRLGVPRFGHDFGERSYPQEAGLKQLVSFAKGCYLGQEVVCTLENRGKLTRRLALFQGAAAADGGGVPPAGTYLKTASDETPGEVTSAVYDPDLAAVLALGYVKRAHAAPGTTLTAAGAHLTLQRVVGDD